MKSILRKFNLSEILISLPSFLWLFIFFAIPSCLLLYIAFKPAGIYGDILAGFTLQNFYGIFKSYYLSIIWRTIWISSLSTFICIVLAVPMAYYMSRVADKWKEIILVLVILPFWTNFLIRIFAWKVVLNPEGILKQILVFLHLANENSLLLYHSGTIVLVMVYTSLPFAILPIYSASEKFDFNLLDAARDLGASRFISFVKVFIPGISKGLQTALIMVLIPAIGSYVIPDLVGGANSEMIGNVIASKVFVARNIPMSAAWSTALMVIILLPFGIIFTFKILNRMFSSGGAKR